jgi:cytochrome c
MMLSIFSCRILAGGAVLASLSACGGDKPTEKSAQSGAQVATVEPVPPVAAPPVAAPPAVAFASLTGDAVAGAKIFGQCKTCHVAEAGVNRIGPSLWGVVGRPAGSIAGFKYSPANKSSGLVWSEEQLFTYLEAPQKTIPGTYMAFAGLKKLQDRADVIAYLKTRA